MMKNNNEIVIRGKSTKEKNDGSTSAIIYE
jgi:hypothetical protein